MEWTKEQKRIIDLRNSNILVSAAAGSGKTAVLVERIIKLVKDEQVDIDKFLVVTFTNAAAAGMKQKIQKALVKVAQEDGNVRHIRKQLSLLNKAQITTIHSFCLDVVRKNFHAIGVDLNFRIGDTSELSILLQESIDEVLERAYTKGEDDFNTLTESFTSNRGDTELSQIITNLYKFILSFPDPLKWLEDSVEGLNITEEEFLKSSWYKEIVDYVKMQLDGAIDIIKEGLRICDEPDGPTVGKETLKIDLQIVEELKNLLSIDLKTFINSVAGFEAPTFKGYHKTRNPMPQGVNEDKLKEVKEEIRKAYKDIINGLKEQLPYFTLDKYVGKMNHMYKPMVALKELVIDLDDIYKNKKLEKSVLDFSDLEHYALKILRKEIETDEYEPSDIAKSYQNKFSYIFIDEYQDSNNIQETIIGQIKRDNNLFMVGDVKQSIYRFRLADPSIFNRKYSVFKKDSEDLSDEVVDRIIELNKNFRSRKDILDATNFVFKNIMSKELGEIDYTENVYLHCGNDFPDRCKVELDIIDMDSINEIQVDDKNDDSSNNDGDDVNADSIGDEIESLQTAELEAIHAANKVKELITREIYNSSKDKLRKIDYKDIVILLRSAKGWSSVFEEVFNREGIPFYFEGGAGYFDTIEIQVILNLLKLIDNIKQDIPLISVMRSPIGNFTTEELIEIRTKYGKTSFIGACNKYIRNLVKDEEVENEIEVEDNDASGSEEGFSIELAAKLKEFRNRIYNWSDRSKYTHLSDLIWEILMETNYYNFVGALPNGKLRQANLRLLTDKAQEFEKTSMRGLFKFLRYVEKISTGSEDKTSTAKTLGENDNVVRLMTTHSSKGLEFPVVILCGLNKQFSKLDTRPKIMMHKEYGIGTKYVNVNDRIETDTLGRLAIKNKITFENLSEEMRILYVAMTRAIDRLIMVGTIKKLNEKVKIWRKGHSRYFIFKGQSYLDWIGGCLFEGTDLETINNIFKQGEVADWKVKRITYSDLLKDMDDLDNKSLLERMKEFESNVNLGNPEEIERRLSFKYPYEYSIKTPTKLAVTESKNLNKEKFERLRYKIPPLSSLMEFNKENNKFLLDKKEYSGANIGTLIHLVMEHLDIKHTTDRDSILKQLDDMTSKNLITESETRFVVRNYLDKIEAFYNSELGSRMKNSSLVNKEVPFVIKKKANAILDNLSQYDDILIQGIIDCYFIENDEVVIIDYKTDSAKDGHFDVIKAEYYDQIALYKEALEKIEKKKVKESYLFLMSLGKAVEI